MLFDRGQKNWVRCCWRLAELGCSYGNNKPWDPTHDPPKHTVLHSIVLSYCSTVTTPLIKFMQKGRQMVQACSFQYEGPAARHGIGLPIPSLALR